MNRSATILVVEDDPGSLVTLTALLEAEDYLVEACGTAEEALKYIATSAPMDLVLTDLKLPDGSGLQIQWAVKKLNPDAALILTTGHASIETAIEAVNGGVFAYHVKPLDLDALLTSIRNAITQHELLVENRRLLEKLREANLELLEKLQVEQASQAKTQVLATVTHELKTPLTSIIGYVDRVVLDREAVGPLNEKQERYLGRVQSESQRLRRLIDDLVDISLIEASRLEFTLTDLEVGPEIEKVVTSYSGAIEDKQIHLLLHVPAGLPPVTADLLRFSQIANNLLSNACKYSPPGSTVTITAKEKGDFIQIDFADTGIGISQADQASLFAKFFRSNNSPAGSEQGTGLGLFIAKNLVETQNGEIWVSSQEGQGSTFSFTLPRANRTDSSRNYAHRANDLGLELGKS